MLDRNYTDLPPAKIRETFERIYRQVRVLNAMLDDLLDIRFTEENRPELKPQPFDLKSLVEDTINTQASIDSHKHDLVFQIADQLPSVEVVLDINLTRRIIDNLISNAIKYSPKGSQVIVALGVQNDNISLSVQDQGIGIPPEDEAKLFHPFGRCKNAQNIKGNGIGLTIVKNFIEAQQGQISYQSALGKGTTFEVTLPRVVT
jgi:signal transduction histidine kinase